MGRGRSIVSALALFLALVPPARSLAFVDGAPEHDRLSVAASRTWGLGARPSIVVIVADDLRADSIHPMDELKQHILSRGVTFKRAFVSNPYCCPSRTSILTGNYSHTTKIYTNGEEGWGGWPLFHRRHEERSTIATWLHSDGYTTALIGKYLNGYKRADGAVPRGWDRWVAFSVGGSGGRYYDYDLSVDGRLVHHGWSPSDYSTHVLAEEAVSTIRSAPQARPLFLYFGAYAPHGPWIPAPRDTVPLAWLPRVDPAVNEQDMSDKPAYLRDSQPSPSTQRQRFHKAINTLPALDRAIGRIVGALRKTGRLHDTMLIFVSDNGASFGEHDWDYKLVPYEESINVPLGIRYDPMTAGDPRTNGHLVLNIDLAPTMADLAGVSAPPTDGRSLLPLLQHRDGGWRRSFLIEHAGVERRGVPAYCGVRTLHWKYVRYADGFEELYRLTVDPHELQNLYRHPSSHRMLVRLRNLTRRLCTPLPPSMPRF